MRVWALGGEEAPGGRRRPGRQKPLVEQSLLPTLGLAVTALCLSCVP